MNYIITQTIFIDLSCSHTMSKHLRYENIIQTGRFIKRESIRNIRITNNRQDWTISLFQRQINRQGYNESEIEEQISEPLEVKSVLIY